MAGSPYRRAVLVACLSLVACATPPSTAPPASEPAHPVDEHAEVSPSEPDAEPASEPQPKPEPEPKPLVIPSDLPVRLEDCQLLLDRPIDWVGYSETMQPESLEVLDDLAELMRLNPTLTLSIGVHIDSRGRSSFNLALTERRAAVIADYLSNAGIDEGRLTARGYGERRPINDAPREVQTRVEFWRSDHPSCRYA